VIDRAFLELEMANLLYPKVKEAFISKQIDVSADTIKVALVDTGVYSYSASHEFLSDLSGVVGTAQTLASKTKALGVFDAADPTFTAVSGNTVEACVVYHDTGTPSTSRLIAYIDTATGLPVTPNGGNIVIQWDATGIFAL
jgi:hypothetical protein